jgi:hypothetical protein
MKIHLPAFGPDLPVHPRTGLTALGLRRNGAPIWPVKGGAPDDDTGDGDDAGDDADSGDDGAQDDSKTDLGEAGKQAISRMKAERNAARKELRDVKTQLDKLAPLQKLADVLGGQAGDDGDGKPDVDALAQRLAQHENELKSERSARFRAEVAHEKGLTAAQARRLVGDTRDELAKDADELLKDFKTSDNGRSGRNGPRPDPSQGNRGGKPMSGREQALAEAQKRFGTKSTAT